jgi:arylsulfatase A-like enzyme
LQQHVKTLLRSRSRHRHTSATCLLTWHGGCTSYTDYNIGQILDTLEATSLSKDTVVVMFGDHGYQLGEHDTWSKMTNFELGVRDVT